MNIKRMMIIFNVAVKQLFRTRSVIFSTLLMPIFISAILYYSMCSFKSVPESIISYIVKNLVVLELTMVFFCMITWSNLPNLSIVRLFNCHRGLMKTIFPTRISIQELIWGLVFSVFTIGLPVAGGTVLCQILIIITESGSRNIMFNIPLYYYLYAIFLVPIMSVGFLLCMMCFSNSRVVMSFGNIMIISVLTYFFRNPDAIKVIKYGLPLMTLLFVSLGYFLVSRITIEKIIE